MSIPRVSKFPVGAIMDRLQTESHRFQLSDDNRRVKAIRGEGAAGQHRRPGAAIPESTLTHARTSTSLPREGNHTSNNDADGTLTLHANDGTGQDKSKLDSNSASTEMNPASGSMNLRGLL